MMRLRPAFDGYAITYACTMRNAGAPFGLDDVVLLSDANRNSGMGILRMMLQTRRLVARVRPTTVVSTGALPGLVTVVWGRLYGARCIWVESIANGQKMSASGSVARYLAHRCYVQWPELADGKRAIYSGAVL